MIAETKAAIVTGGGQGIGKCVALRLLEEGWAVGLVDLDREAGEEAEAELRELGPVRFFYADVAEPGSAHRAVEGLKGIFGRLDLLVNNAGIMIRKPVEELSIDEWNRVLAVNLTGPFLMTKYAAPYLRKTCGSIVNVASTRAFMSEPNTEAYSASKGGIVALTHALAMSLGPDIRVNCVSPGWIEVSDWKKASLRIEPVLTREDHAQHPVGRVGRPEDIAGAVLFLASPDAGFISGANFVLDGGMVRKMIYV